jgi:hypothetical protein
MILMPNVNKIRPTVQGRATHIHPYKYIYTDRQTDMDTYIHTHIHILYKYIHTYIHTYIQVDTQTVGIPKTTFSYSGGKKRVNLSKFRDGFFYDCNTFSHIMRR